MSGQQNERMTDIALKGTDVLLFDVMGTVVDDVGTVRKELAAAGAADADAATSQWDEHLSAAMAAVNDGRRPWVSHHDLCAEAFAALIAAGTLPNLDLADLEHLTDVVERYEPWPDSVAAIETLRTQVRVVALSNADFGELIPLFARSGLSWHAVVSGELAHRFKPDGAVYRAAVDLLRVDAAQVMLVAAHTWDLRAAATHGIRTAFVARPGAEAPRTDDQFTMEVDDLGALAHRIAADAPRRQRPGSSA